MLNVIKIILKIIAHIANVSICGLLCYYYFDFYKFIEFNIPIQNFNLIPAVHIIILTISYMTSYALLTPNFKDNT